MASVTFDHASRVYPGADKPAVDQLCLDIADGEFLVLVGPSGCGKSTSLRMLAGLEDVNGGRILIGDKDVTDVPPKNRDIAMVFQNYALYPHMSVRENMGFALKIAGVSKEEINKRVEEAAKIDGASGLRTVWSIKLPLVLQSTVPLLIASFAFNFNNFSLIYMLTGGGPNYPGMDVGQTDILISMVYKIAIESGSPNYGLASAMSIVIFIVVGVIAWLGFRQTKTLEEL